MRTRPLPKGAEYERDFLYFGFPQEQAWALAEPEGVTVRYGGGEYELLPLAGVVACPGGLHALRSARTGQMLSEQRGLVGESAAAALPVRVWLHAPLGRYALQVVCGPRDTAPQESLLTFLGAGPRYVGAAFALAPLRAAQALWSLSGTSLVCP
jgi:hypothetical protein